MGGKGSGRWKLKPCKHGVSPYRCLECIRTYWRIAQQKSCAARPPLQKTCVDCGKVSFNTPGSRPKARCISCGVRAALPYQRGRWPRLPHAVCSRCGGPRYLKADRALCRPCYTLDNRMKMRQYSKKLGNMKVKCPFCARIRRVGAICKFSSMYPYDALGSGLRVSPCRKCA